MRRVAEIIHIVPEEREAFIEGANNLDIESQRFLWMCGVRNQTYFQLGELYVMTFAYEGNDFDGDMAKMTSYLRSQGHLIEKRRKDVPVGQLNSTNWWAPMKKVATVVGLEAPFEEEEKPWDEELTSMLSGCMVGSDAPDIAFDDDEWDDCFRV